jgi:DNA-binding SARP family transcriptional activator
VLELHTFGITGLRTRLAVESTSMLLQPKRLALLIYLALAPRRRLRRRDQVVALFWPDLDEEHARGSLSQGLRYLRRAIGDGMIITQGDEEVGADRTRLWCDAFEFGEACEGGAHGAAAGLYKGVFLDGFYVADASPEYDRWVAEERSRFRGMATRAATALTEAAETEGDRVKAVEWARQAAAHSPDDETVVARLIRLLDLSGDRMGALNTYEGLRVRLREEFGVAPSKETQALIAALLAR